MVKKVLFLLVSCLIVLSLLLASCAPAEEKEIVTEEGKVMVKDSLGKLVEKPKYGGTITFAHFKTPTRGWDQALTADLGLSNSIVTDSLIMADWTKGPAGTNEASWQSSDYIAPEHLVKGMLAESWELKDPVTMVYHLRKGVRFHNKPPANGREMTADDVVYNLKRYYTEPKSYVLLTSPEGHVPVSITAVDKYTVEVVLPDPQTAPLMFLVIGRLSRIIPHEVVEKYGDMSDWRNVCGTGPFMLVEEVADAATTFVRHPNYWEMDPLHPENQLPYADGYVWVQITDASTRLAALRTQKVDLQRDITWEDGELMAQSYPDLEYIKYLYTLAREIHMRLDNPEFPWCDKKVRQALSLAIDNKTIKDDFYGGNAEVLANPVVPLTECLDFYVPLEDLPANVQELYEYHPDKAKQLLAEAGYPDGFKCTVSCMAPDVALLSMVKAMWADIGVDMILDVKESGTLYGMMGTKGHKEMIFIFGGVTSVPSFVSQFDPEIGGRWNLSRVNDAKVNENAQKIREAIVAGDYDEQCRLTKEIIPYILEQSWTVQPPDPCFYFMWWPWLKRFNGEFALGQLGFYAYMRYLWIDQDLKEEMTGRR